MKLRTYFIGLTTQERVEFAKRCGTSVQHIKNIAYGNGTPPCGESLAINIERESGGAVRCETLRPDVDWEYLRGTALQAAA